ncbi:hypothetical protein [Chengkuizengella axinellae]|uniref:DUF2642 domain-containing protein n=1 Tax=Chengkuizengella axinellae TaxID=3064388 RepID=A0ABT9J2B6_9BACL|nr:hypothetical protein [Chengkuizengella sp. 2205SS18-9]MDP5275567.1 hypothetical protein [Chengkuizengella sp. 2205SS18-9]
MGVFQENICDCCVCPMQCVLQQFIRENVVIRTLFTQVRVMISSVKDFNVIGSDPDSGIPICVPISQILSFLPEESKLVTLKSIRKNVKGDCACIEDSLTNKLTKKINDNVNIGSGFNDLISGTITQVGEGIVIVENEVSQQFIISTCNGVFFVENVPNR